VNVVAAELEQAHVTDVEQAGRAPHGQMLFLRRAVPQRHLPAGKGRHPSARPDVDVIQGGCLRSASADSCQAKAGSLTRPPGASVRAR